MKKSNCIEWVVLAMGLLAAVPAQAVFMVHDFYLPMPEAQIRTSLVALQPATGTTMDSVFSIVATGNGTIIHYDHWEDGYEIDINNPVQGTTQIWGDGNNANGKPPNYANDPAGLSAGAVISLRNLVTLPRNAATVLYDARDRVTASKAIVVSRAAWATNPGSVLAGAVEVNATIDYGTSFIAPVGQDVSAATMFEYVALYVMAAENNTSVTIDVDGTGGTAPFSITLNRGESYHVNGGIKKGATVVASKPVQAHLLTGDIGANYESRWFTLYPLDQWYSSYITPVGTAADADPAYVFVYNPGVVAMTINYTTRVGSGSFSVGAGASYQWQVPQNSGARLASAGGEPFFALSAVGANPTANNVHDWGFTLVPESGLTTEAVVGWGPGSGDLTQNGSPVWVAPAAATRIYIDFNGDRAGPLTDPNGVKYDVHYDLATLESKTIYDPDKDQTAMRLYTLDGVFFATAWGQDPAVAGPGNPFLDLGTTVLPFPVPVIRKSSTLITDNAPAGLSINDILEYRIEVDNKGLLPLGNTLVLDSLPVTIAYQAGTTTYNGAPIADGVSGTIFPLDESGYTIPIILRGGTSVFTYRVAILASGSIRNTAVGPGLSVDHEVEVPPPAGCPPVDIEFTGSGATPVSFYQADDDVYVWLSFSGANTNNAGIDTMLITVENDTRGDLETLLLTETSATSGVFFSVSPLPSSTTSGLSVEDDVLYALAGDTLSAGFVSYCGSSDSDTAVIAAPSATKVLYLTTDGADDDRTGALDRIDPVAASDGTTSRTAILAAPTTVTSNFTVAGESNWTVPAGVTSVTVKAWGGGGGGGGGGAALAGGAGGGGGFATRVVAVTNGQQLVVRVGAGGGAGLYSSAGADSVGTGGGGGGLSRVTTNGAAALIAGGGGGGGGGDNLAGAPNGGAGGAGGGTNGVAGGNAGGTVTGGGAGTAAAGGTGGTLGGTNGASLAGGVGGTAPSFSVTLGGAGGALGGGNGGRASTSAGRAGGGGGGGGYFGGGGGGASNAGSTSGGGGGGGSGLAPSGALATGSGTNAAARTDVDYAGNAGRGGLGGAVAVNGSTGNTGRVVIRYDFNDSAALTQTPAFSTDFTMPAGGIITVTSHVAIASGTMPNPANVTAQLLYGSTVFFSDTNANYSAAGGVTTLVWSAVLPSITTIPSNAAITLVVFNRQSGVTFRMEYDSQTRPSRIALPASTLISIDSLGVYDAPYPGGSLVASVAAGQTVYVRSQVRDPFGAYDITGLDLAIPSAGIAVSLNNSSVVASNTYSKTYEYAWSTAAEGTYEIAVTAKEGTEGITATKATSLIVSFLDLGTPSITEFTIGNNGPHTEQYLTNQTVSVRVTDLDQNKNPGVAETVDVVITTSSGDKETITLTETGPDTGIFTASITASSTVDGGDENDVLYAPSGTLLYVTYTDPDDPTDQSDDTATVPLPSGTPGISVVKTLAQPADGTALVGETVQYDIQVVNIGSTVLTNVSLVDTFPTNRLSYAGAVPSPNSVAAGSLTWTNIGPLAVSQSKSYTVSFTALASTPAATNSAVANAGGGVISTGRATVAISSPIHQVTKTLLSPNPGPAGYGSLVVFRIAVTNTGSTAIATLPLEDTFSMATFEYVSATVVPDSVAAGSLLWLDLTGAGSLAAGGVLTVDVTLRVTGSANPGLNTATANYSVDVNGDPVPPAGSSTGLVTQAASIKGTVWNDVNINGTNNVGEPGIESVTLYLYTDPNGDGDPADGALVQVVATGTNGFYEFVNLGTGAYVAVEADLPGYASSGDRQGANDNRIAINVVASSAYVGNDFYDYLVDPADYATIEGTVWYDINGSGTNDPAEPGLVGVTVELIADVNGNGSADPGEPVVASAFTEAGGTYLFSGVAAGDYIIREVDPSGFFSTGDTAGANDNRIAVTAAAGVVSAGNDFHDTRQILQPSIGDRVWVDEDGDGVQDAGEAGLPNVVVELLDTNGDVVATTVTDTEGRYLFTGISLGTFTVRVDTTSLPTGLAAHQTFDPDATVNHQTTVTLTSASPQVTDADFGYNWSAPGDVTGNTGLGSIGDRVWIDADGDGVQDPGEPGLGGVTVVLFADSNGDGTYDQAVGTNVTDAAGGYLFDNLAPGAYAMVVNGGADPAGYTPTGDPDGVFDNRTTTPIILAPGDVVVNADFGYRPNSSSDISGMVYLDANANSNLNAGVDSGIAGVTVALLDAGGKVIATTVTDATGGYTFSGLPAGDYTVWVNDTGSLLGNLSQTGDPDATVNGRHTVTVNGVNDVNNVNFGYTPDGHSATSGLIGNTIYLDRDGNGQPGAGEGVQGVRVLLYDSTGTNLLEVALTDAGGSYAFGGLSTNNAAYFVRVDTSSLPNGGAGLVNSVDPDGAPANQASVTLTGALPIRLDQDFGYTAASPNTIGGTLWEDRSADGTLGAGETDGLAGVTVALYSTNGTLVATTMTDANGDYEFTGLPDGTYRVDVTDASNVLNGWWHSTGPAPGTDNNSQADPYTVTVSGGAVNTTGDFGYYVDGAAVGNRVWHDVNANGQQDAGESGMPGVTVKLQVIYPNGVTNEVVTVTDADGFYRFGNLLLDENTSGGAGSPQYILSVVNPGGGYKHTYFNKSGVTAALNSDYPLGAVAVTAKGVDNIPINADPSLEASAGWIDFGFTLTPTLAVITAVRARVEDGVAVISWDVSLELDTAGYYLERLIGGAWQRVNAALIPPQLFISGTRTYEQSDPGAPLGTTQSYRIIELDNRGRLLPYGPYALKLDGGGISYATWSAEVAWNGASADPDADPDRDGLTNLQEYLAGTDPLSANSVLRVNRAEAVAEGLRLTWNSTTGRVYAVEMTLSLDQPFVAIATGLASEPPENSYVVPVAPDAVRNAYFRVVVSQP